MKDTLKNCSLSFERATKIGKTGNYIPNIDEWDNWQGYLDSPETKSFYEKENGVSFTKKHSKTSAGKKLPYWIARKRINGQLYTIYAGKSEDINLKTIQETIIKLMEKIENANR